MSTVSSTYGSTAVGDTGLDYVPKGILLNGAGTGHPLPNGHSNGTMNMKDEPPAAIGHNSGAQPMPKDASGKAPSWATPSKQTFDEAAAANTGSGRHLHQNTVLIDAIFDRGSATLPSR
jgi:hypothetical protein